MLQVAKKSLLCASVMSLSACASVFSSYESEFSCKNSDHGGCTHPLEAYEEARSQSGSDFGAGSVTAEIIEEDLDDMPHGHAQAQERSDYQSYQDASYSELENLVANPDTPVLAPAKTVRTLILPYTDPRSSDRLYMPRYIYSVLENSRFVLGNYLTRERSGLSLNELIRRADEAAPNAESQEE
jgi:conjugal transfer pilus assembly protein TraV